MLILRFYYFFCLLLKLYLEKQNLSNNESQLTLNSEINKPLLLCENEPSTSANKPDLKTATDISSEIFSKLNWKQSLSLYSTSSIDDFSNCESKKLFSITSTSSSEPVTHSHLLITRPIQTSYSSSTRSTSSSSSANLRPPASSTLKIFLILCLIFQSH